MVVSRVALNTGPRLDLDKVITKKEIQCQNIPSNKTYETSPTSITRAGDTGVSETGQMIGAYGMDGNIVAIQHRMGKQMPTAVYGNHKKGPETFPIQAIIHGPMVTGSTIHSANHDAEVFEDAAVLKTSVGNQKIPSWNHYPTGFKITREHSIHE